MFPDVRVTVFDALMANVLCLDAVTTGDIGNGVLKYEDSPMGCASGQIPLALTYAQIEERGYWGNYGIVEISTADDTLQTAITAGATKLYVTSTELYDPSLGEDAQQIYLWDGINLTMRIPVTGIGTDGGGPYITVGTPIAGGGNATTIPAYGVGAYIGRRRYSGRMVKRTRVNSRNPQAQITLSGWTATLSKFGTFTIQDTDSGAAAYAIMSQFASSWPFLTISAGNFPTVGSDYNGQETDYSAVQMVSDILACVPTGDLWVMRIGHDRMPRMMKLYTDATNTYTYNIALAQGVTAFEPLQVQIVDEDATNLYNSVRVTASNNILTPANTNTDAVATVEDGTSITDFGQVDGQPVTQIGLLTTQDCINFGTALLNQNSLPASNAQIRVYVRNDNSETNEPLGVPNGDVVRGVDCVTITRFDDTGSVSNQVPDSEFQYTTGPEALWSLSGLSQQAGTGPNGSNILRSSIGAGVAIGYEDGASPYMDVTPGQVISFGGWIDASSCSGAGAPYIGIFNTAVSGSPYDSVSQVNGHAGFVYGQWTVPPGVYQVRFVFDTGNAIVASSTTIGFSEPMFEVGTETPTYAPNYAAPAMYGIVSSAVTTIDPHGDRYQDIKFAAIEPDWNSAMAARGRALANSIANNTAPGLSISAYCVSSTVGTISLSPSSLTITIPTLNAIFATGTAAQTIHVQSLGLAANATNWVWLSPSGSYSAAQIPDTVTGSILIGYFTTNASGVIGYTLRAPIGITNNSPGLGNATVSVPTSGAGSPALANYVTGAATYGCDITFTPTWTALLSAIKEVLIMAVPHGAATNSTWLYGASAAWGSGSIPNNQLSGSGTPVTIHMANMPTGVACDLYLFLVGFDGSWIYPSSNPIATTAAQTFNKAAAPKMPAGATVSASSISVGTGDPGMQRYSSSGAYIGQAPELVADFTLGDSNSDPSTNWGYEYVLGVRPHAASTPTLASSYTAYPSSPGPTFGNGAAVSLRSIVTAGQAVDVAFWIIDAQGDQTNCVQLISNYTVAAQNALPPVTGPIVGGGHLLGGTGVATTAPIMDSGNVGKILHSVMSAATQDVINAAGQILNVLFSGAVLNAAGALTNVDSQVSTSTVSSPAGTIITFGGVFTGPGGSNIIGFDFGGNLASNYYRVLWDNTSFRIVHVISGTGTIIDSMSGPSLDTSAHTLEVAIQYGTAPVVQAVLDGKYVLSVIDTAPPAQPSAINIKPYTGGSSGSLANFYCQTGLETLVTSGVFDGLLPNIPNWTTNLVLEYTSSGTSPNITMKFYYDDGTAATDATIYNPDGTTVDVGHTTSGSPSTSISSISSGETVYYLMYYKKVTATMVIVAQTTAFTLSQINAAYADGGFVAFNATTSTVGTGISGGGSGGVTGGGIGNHQRY